MFRSRSWFGGGWGRQRKPHSLEQLKYLHTVLSRNTVVSENNRGLLVESLRCIAEILIWGDQNDSSVFDFFLEKNMLSYFLRIMRQRSGGASYVCVQLLQTLNILFENIRNETSLYYLLSNNHVNSIIVHKFDFSDEEVMAYYISFLKTLSLKLNGHTIHFFYNEHTKDFPLYTEAIKFFNHPESMVRIAVRTLTLNVYRVQDASMLRFIRDRTAAPYFSNLVWFIGKHILELDSCVRNDADHQSQQRLNDLVAEHLDHLHYINDILCLNIPDLNDVLTEHLLHKLFIPLYVYSLTSDKPKSMEVITQNLKDVIMKHNNDVMSPTKRLMNQKSDIEDETKPKVSCVMSLFLLSQVFLIITHGPIVHALAWIILQSDATVFEEGATKILEMYLRNKKACVKLEFSKPRLTLEKALESQTTYDEYLTPGTSQSRRSFGMDVDKESDPSICELDPDLVSSSLPSTSQQSETSSVTHDSNEDITQIQPHPVAQSASCVTLASENLPDSPLPDSGIQSQCLQSVQPSDMSNITDEEKQKLLGNSSDLLAVTPTLESLLEKEKNDVELKPFLKTILESMDCVDSDYKPLFALCLLFALINNKGVNTELLDQLLCSAAAVTDRPQTDADVSPARSTKSSTDGPRTSYNALFVDRLMSIVQNSCKTTSKVRLVTVELTVRLLRVSLEGARGAGQRPLGEYLSLVEAHRNKAASVVKNYYKCDDIFLDMFEDEYCEMSKRPLNVEWLCMDAAILLPPTRSPMSGIELAKRLPSDDVERTRRAIRTYFLVRDLYLKLTGKPETQLPLSNPSPFVKVGEVLNLNESDLISCDIIERDGGWQHRFLAVDHIQIILVEPDRQRLGWGEAKLVGSLQDLEIQGDKDDPRCLHLTIHKPRGAGGALRTVLLRAKFKFDDHIRSMAAKQRLSKGRTKARQKKMMQIGRVLEVEGAWAGVAARTDGRRHRPLFTAGNRLPGYPALRAGHTGGDSEEGSVERRLRTSGHMFKDGVIVYKERTASRDRGSSRTSSAATSRDSSPRPHSEQIPLEHIRRRSASPAAPSAPASSGRLALPAQEEASTSHSSMEPTKSEETSFISEGQAKRKGLIETI